MFLKGWTIGSAFCSYSLLWLFNFLYRNIDAIKSIGWQKVNTQGDWFSIFYNKVTYDYPKSIWILVFMHVQKHNHDMRMSMCVLYILRNKTFSIFPRLNAKYLVTVNGSNRVSYLSRFLYAYVDILPSSLRA